MVSFANINISSVCIDNNNQLYIAGQTFGSFDNGKYLKLNAILMLYCCTEHDNAGGADGFVFVFTTDATIETSEASSSEEEATSDGTSFDIENCCIYFQL
jgi:hypothetical protein